MIEERLHDLDRKLKKSEFPNWRQDHIHLPNALITSSNGSVMIREQVFIVIKTIATCYLQCTERKKLKMQVSQI